MHDLTPGPHFPGLRITADGRRAAADYVCRCGQSARATGPAEVRALIATYTDHKSSCSARRS